MAGSNNRAVRWRWLLWGAMATLAGYFVAKHALPKFVLSQEVYTEYYWERRGTLLTHVISGLAALLLGPLQFFWSRRETWMALHRWTGRSYLLCTFVAAITAVVLAYTAPVTQPLYAVGLYGVSAFWLYSGFRGWLYARSRRSTLHRRWMIRNYTTTFFFVLFFAFFDGLMWFGWPEEDWANAITWAVWLGLILPLIVVELCLRLRTKSQSAAPIAPAD